MYVLRLYMRTGLQLDHNFEDLAPATTALDAISACRRDKREVQILDDAGRQVRFDGRDLLAESLIDVGAETTSVMRLGVFISNIGDQVRQQLGLPPQQEASQPQRRQEQASVPSAAGFLSVPGDGAHVPFS